ncbi:unnamed protein product [Cyprideis torosa]|uniref:Uncharacterized protein n=2 Tax=Cyprideis torosa TaxID=163714 RepID=A0A7R8ZJ69_9CRUS|nr:unnamed protein product [Cyprideis torosa]CAG0886237.1 unnamed protein product [Cyprideis torosa]
MDRKMSIWNNLDISDAAQMLDWHDTEGKPKIRTTIDALPDKVLMKIFSYLPHREICRNAVVCKKWRLLAYNSKLWTFVSLRPEISGLHVTSLESLLALISVRFGSSLRYIELPIELITHSVLHELANRCPNLTVMLLDFSTAMQLHDFNELQAFPTKLRTLTICLSGVIFMEGFMRKIYNFINGLEVLHLIGTYEMIEEEEEEIYEVINIHKLKSSTPNLTVVLLYGINFLDDGHVEAFSSNCIQLECLCINYCSKVKGASLKILFQRCKKLSCFLANQTGILSDNLIAVNWAKTALEELDITGTDLTSEALKDILLNAPPLRFLAAGLQDGFTDKVLLNYMENGNPSELIALDLSRCDNLSTEVLSLFLKKYGQNLRGLILSGIPQVTDSLLVSNLPTLKNLRILGLGMAEGCCAKIQQKILVDQLIDSIAANCSYLERLDLSWDPDTLRHSDKSQKAIDTLRLRCLRLKCFILSDGKFYEIVKANFERADRYTVVRMNTCCRVTNDYLLNHYPDLLFN